MVEDLGTLCVVVVPLWGLMLGTFAYLCSTAPEAQSEDGRGL